MADFTLSRSTPSQHRLRASTPSSMTSTRGSGGRRSTVSRVAVDLDFLKPFKASNVTTFDLAPSGDGTDVTWTISGTRSAVMGLTGKLFVDKAIAGDFDKGPAALRREAERTTP